jgi:hypothetical protein
VPGRGLADAGEESGPLVVVAASEAELAAHQARLAAIAQKSGDKLVWREDLAPA